jgi:pSer/pThr/pTyr-binding forkhead associated (FHA) protein
MPRFIIKRGLVLHGSFAINANRITFGRGEECTICIPDLSLSRLQFSIERMDGNLILNDNRSANGTFVNGTQVTHSLLKHNDTISAGIFQITLHIDESERLPAASLCVVSAAGAGDHSEEVPDEISHSLAVESIHREWRNLAPRQLFAWGKLVTLCEILIGEKAGLKQRLLKTASVNQATANSDELEAERFRGSKRLAQIRRTIANITLIFQFDEQWLTTEYVATAALPAKMKEGFGLLLNERLRPVRQKIQELVQWLEKDITPRELIARAGETGVAIRNEIERLWQEKQQLISNELQQYQRDNERLSQELQNLIQAERSHPKPERQQQIHHKETLVRNQNRRIREYQYYLENLGEDPMHALSVLRTMREIIHVAGDDPDDERVRDITEPPVNQIIEQMLNQQILQVREKARALSEGLKQELEPRLLEKACTTRAEYADLLHAMAHHAHDETRSGWFFKRFLLYAMTHPDLIDVLDAQAQVVQAIRRRIADYRRLLNETADAFLKNVGQLIEEGGSPVGGQFRDFFREVILNDLQLLAQPDLADMLMALTDGSQLVAGLRAMCGADAVATALLCAAFFDIVDPDRQTQTTTSNAMVDMEVPLRRQLIRLTHLEHDDAGEGSYKKTLENLKTLPTLIEIKTMQSRIIRERGIDRAARRMSHRLEKELRHTIRQEGRWYGWTYPLELRERFEAKLRQALEPYGNDCSIGRPEFWSTGEQGRVQANRWPPVELEQSILAAVLAEAQESPRFKTYLTTENQPSIYTLFDLHAFMDDIAEIMAKKRFFQYIRSQFTDVERLQKVEDMVSAIDLTLNASEFQRRLQAIDDNCQSLKAAMEGHDDGDTIFEPHCILEEIESMVAEANEVIADFNTSIRFFDVTLREEEQFLPLIPLDTKNLQIQRTTIDGMWFTKILTYLWEKKSPDNDTLLHSSLILALADESSWEEYRSHLRTRRFALASGSPVGALLMKPAETIFAAADALPASLCAHYCTIMNSLNAEKAQSSRLLLLIHACVIHPALAKSLAGAGSTDEAFSEMVKAYCELMNRCGKEIMAVMMAYIRGDVFRFRKFLLDIFDEFRGVVAAHPDLGIFEKHLRIITTDNHAEAITALSGIIKASVLSDTMGLALTLILSALSLRSGRMDGGGFID